MSRLDVRGLVEVTTWLDTHEHLIEEETRLSPPVAGSEVHPCDDWAYLFWHYGLDDLRSAGMPPDAAATFARPDVDALAKWDAWQPYYERTRNTAYVQAALDSIRRLFDLELCRETAEEITARMARARRPGFYQTVLEAAGVTACQVNSLERTFCETAQPEILQQDLGMTDFVLPSPARLADWQRVTGREVGTMTDLLAVIDEYFERFGTRTVAVKLAIADARPLAVAQAPARFSGGQFADWLHNRPVDPRAARAIGDTVLNHGLALASDLRLPVKLHTGLHVGNDRMDLAMVRDNVSDACRLAKRYPTTFVLMHIAYPFDPEVIAAAKHYSNVVADLCWAWIIDPVATRLFVQRFLTAAPASKLLCFGGDYIPVENVVGHAHLARRELARALATLREEEYLDDAQIAELVPALMHGNAERIFGLPERTRGR